MMKKKKNLELGEEKKTKALFYFFSIFKYARVLLSNQVREVFQSIKRYDHKQMSIIGYYLSSLYM